MSKKRLNIFTYAYPFGQEETFLHNEIEYLIHEFDITIYPALKRNKEDSVRPLSDGVQYRNPFLPRSYFKRLFMGVFNTASILPFVKDFFTLLKHSGSKKESLLVWFFYTINNRYILANADFKALIQQCKQNKDDIIYFYWAHFPIHLANINTGNVFIRVHGGEVNFERNHGYIPQISQKILNTVTYLPISEDALDRITKINNNAHCIISRLGVFDYGVNPRPSSTQPVTIISCSDVIKLKRVHLIAEALKNYNGGPLKWIHFGDGPELKNLKKTVQQLPDTVAVEFPGRISNDNLTTFYRNNPIDLFINVSETEGVPVSIMEALSFGIPCFATNAGGTSELLDESGGKIVDVDFNSTELTDYIKSIRALSDEQDLRAGARKLWRAKAVAETNYDQLAKLFFSHE